jgi:hypothetical protein
MAPNKKIIPINDADTTVTPEESANEVTIMADNNAVAVKKSAELKQAKQPSQPKPPKPGKPTPAAKPSRVSADIKKRPVRKASRHGAFAA